MTSIRPIDIICIPSEQKSHFNTCYLGRTICILTHAFHTLSGLCIKIIFSFQRQPVATNITESPITDPPEPPPPPTPIVAHSTCRHYLPRKAKDKKSHLEPKLKSLASLHFGAGMQNGGNTCYIAAVLQALRHVPSFQKHLLAHNPLAKQIKQLYRYIETELLPGSDTAYFRQVCMQHGWEPTYEFSQEDPRQFCQFLLDKLGFPPFQFRTKISHDLPLQVPSLDRQGGFENYIELSLGEATDGTRLQQVAGNSLVIEEIEKAHLPQPAEEDPEDFQRCLDSLTDITMIPTHQTIQLVDIPQILPIALRRDRFDRTTMQASKATTQILASNFLELPLADNSQQKVRYQLKSIIVRDGTSAFIGHCRTFVPQNGAYIEFDDSSSVLHADTRPIDALISQHGLLFFYERLDVVYN